MPTGSNLDQQSWIQRNVLWLASVFFLGSLAMYLFNFSGPLSRDQGTWGEFGDFMGGVVNPFVGLCTVWLLTVSLKHNQIALQQAREELVLARQALEASNAMQVKTELALRQQIEIADQSRDMANAVAIYENIQHQLADLKKAIDLVPGGYSDQSRIQHLKARQKAAGEMARDLAKILNKEAARVICRYSTLESLTEE